MRSLDGLRGIAIVLVVIHHYFYRYCDNYAGGTGLIDLARFGEYGVHLFFALSGFLMVKTAQPDTSLSKFLVGRVSRIFPAYWIAVTITMAITMHVGLEGRAVSPSDYLINLTLMQGILRVSYVDNVYWTLSTECLFYILVAVLVASNTLRHTKTVCLCILLVQSMAMIICEVWFGEVSWRFHKHLFLPYANVFVIGMVFGSARERMDVHDWMLVILAVLVSALFRPLDSIVAVLIAILISAALSPKLRFVMENQVLVLFGSVSYAWYLLHQNLGYILINYLRMSGCRMLLAQCIAFVLSFLIACLFTRFIDVPLASSMKRRLTAAFVQSSAPIEPAT